MGAPVFPTLEAIHKNGVPLPGCRAFFFNAGTTTPRTVYRDDTLSTPHAWPVVMTAADRFPVIWTGTGNLKVRIEDAFGALVDELDGVPGEQVASGGGGGGGGGGTTLEPGFLCDYFGASTVPTGWLRCNGRTIGSAASGATERANDDTLALYTQLWNENTVACPVTGGRGASAAADFAAGKPIQLPDFRARVTVGLPTMGNADNTLLDALTFTLGTKTTLGGQVGVAAAALTVGQMPSHNHPTTIQTGGLHSHPGSISDAIADHTHTVFRLLRSGSAGGNFGAGGGFDFEFPLFEISTASSAAGGHQHLLTITSDGAHSHGVTMTAVGNGDVVSFMQPSALVTKLIKM